MRILLENNNLKTKHEKILIAGVPSIQVLPGYLITRLHLCAFMMYLAC